MELLPHEVEVVGSWSVVDGRVIADAACERIKRLTQAVLRKLAADQSGWDALYRDPGDGRLWELSYPQSEMHGGGPPRLAVISARDAEDKYGHGVTA